MAHTLLTKGQVVARLIGWIPELKHYTDRDHKWSAFQLTPAQHKAARLHLEMLPGSELADKLLYFDRRDFYTRIENEEVAVSFPARCNSQGNWTVEFGRDDGYYTAIRQRLQAQHTARLIKELKAIGDSVRARAEGRRIIVSWRSFSRRDGQWYWQLVERVRRKYRTRWLKGYPLSNDRTAVEFMLPVDPFPRERQHTHADAEV